MRSFSSLLVAICAFSASGSVAAPTAAAVNGQIFIISRGYQAGCVNEDGAFIYKAGNFFECPHVVTSVIGENSLTLSTAKGPCGIVFETFKCGNTVPSTTFTINAFQPFAETYFFSDSKGFSGGLEYTKPGVILNSGAGYFEYSLAFSTLG